MTTVSASGIRTQFFEYLFGEDKGHVCIATSKPKDKASFKQKFFEWPEQAKELSRYIENAARSHNVWFCVNLLKKAERKKENCLPTRLVWADLDACKPSEVEPSPQCAIETSPGRYQAVWRLDQTVDPYVAESYSKRIAYKFSMNGADSSGWDLTQLLRVPFTYNFKYADPAEHEKPPQVDLLHSLQTLLPADVFEAIDFPGGNEEPESVELPDPTSVPPAEPVIYKYLHHLNRTAFRDLYVIEPDKDADWSALMWRLLNICLEAGMSNIETFGVAQAAACNKYKRDNRSLSYLWREIQKADAAQSRLNIITGQFKPLSMPSLVTINDLEGIEPTFIDQYQEWAVDATDAIPAYHDLSAFILLSSVMASGLILETSYGKMVPNLWGLVLGDSTLTRKTTAMRMATEFLYEIDPEVILATDGSAEGLLTGLSTRPNRTSIFFKDEVSGFIDSINRKDYLAGMRETLTQLYDVPQVYTRRLRKDTISIVNPVFIFFGGGIRDKMYSLLTDQDILSGFLPRFLVVSGDADLTKIRTTGPRSQQISKKRSAISDRIANLQELYNIQSEVKIGDQTMVVPSQVEAILSPDAWTRYGDIEMEMVRVASDSPISMYALPTFERLSRSLLKMACLLAGAREPPQDKLIQVEESDIIVAAKYIQDWGRYTIDLISNAGRGATQREMDKIYHAIERKPGVTRSEIMQVYHKTSREANELLGSLEDRGQIRAEKSGRGHRLYAL